MTKSRINWEEVQTQLRAGERALEEALVASPARIQAEFRKRAARLAGIQNQAAPQAPPVSCLIFTLQSEHFAIRLQELAEVLPFHHCTPVPGSAPEFLGVINRHGELRPVVDLARIISQDNLQAGSETQTPGYLLMLRKPNGEIGLRVETVEALREIPAERLQSTWQGNFTSRVAGEPLLLLDLPRLLGRLRGSLS